MKKIIILILIAIALIGLKAIMKNDTNEIIKTMNAQTERCFTDMQKDINIICD